MIFGVDVGGTAIKIGAFKDDGSIIKKKIIPTNTMNKGNHILSEICDSLDSILEEISLGRSDCNGIGIGLPGPVNKNGDILGCVNLGWGIFNIEKSLSDLYSNILVKAANDANLAAFGEFEFGAGKEYNNIAMITLGTGVGGGIISDGSILTGSNGAAGEIGHITVNKEEIESCSCGKKGCLEQYCSVSGLERILKRKLEKNNLKTILNVNSNSKDITEAAKLNDEVAIMVMEEFGDYMGYGLSVLASTVNPDCFVIGGGVSKTGEFLIGFIEKSYKKYAFKPCSYSEIRIATLGNDAGIYGAYGIIAERLKV
jgi:glucokinase